MRFLPFRHSGPSASAESDLARRPEHEDIEPVLAALICGVGLFFALMLVSALTSPFVDTLLCD